LTIHFLPPTKIPWELLLIFKTANNLHGILYLIYFVLNEAYSKAILSIVE